MPLLVELMLCGRRLSFRGLNSLQAQVLSVWQIEYCLDRLLTQIAAVLQLISAGLQWFLDGVYIGMPTVSDQRLNITVRLRDTSSALLTTGNYTFVQVSHAEVAHTSVA